MPATPRAMHACRAVLLGVVVLTVVTTASAAGSSRAQATAKTSPSVFVSPTGSDARSCKSRRAACASFNRAYRVARPGQVVEVAGGQYPAQTFLAALGKHAPNIVFRPTRGERVVVAGIEFGSGGEAKLGPHHITLVGLQTARKGTSPAPGNQYGIFVGPGSRFIRLLHIDAGSVSSWFADHLAVIGGDYGPCATPGFAQNVC